MRVINWANVILTPMIAFVFAVDIYNGTPANFAVWYFAFLGIIYTFFNAIRAIAKH